MQHDIYYKPVYIGETTKCDAVDAATGQDGYNMNESDLKNVIIFLISSYIPLIFVLFSPYFL